MKTTILYEDKTDVKTKIVLVECTQLKFIHIYKYDNDGYVDDDMRIFNPETVEQMTEIFKSHPDFTLYNR